MLDVQSVTRRIGCFSCIAFWPYLLWPAPPVGQVKVLVTFEKPRLKINPANAARGRLDFKDLVRVPAPFVKVQLLLADGNAAMADGHAIEAFTGPDGRVTFPGVPDGTYYPQAVPEMRAQSGDFVEVTAAVYRQGDPLRREGRGQDLPIVPGDYPPEKVLANAWPPPSALSGQNALTVQNGLAEPYGLDIPVKDSKTGRASGPFNILWMVYQGLHWVFINTPFPHAFSMLHINWNPVSNIPGGTYFQRLGEFTFANINAVHAKDTDEFDDSVLAHELGHFVSERFDSFISPGGDHFEPGLYAYDWTLTMSEGWATFFQALLKTQAGYPDPTPDYYDTYSPATSTAQATLLSQPYSAWRKGRKVVGLANEESISRALWRLYTDASVLHRNQSAVIQLLGAMPSGTFPVLPQWAALAKELDGASQRQVDRILRAEGCLGLGANASPSLLRRGPGGHRKGLLRTPPRANGDSILPGGGNQHPETVYLVTYPETLATHQVRIALHQRSCGPGNYLVAEIFHRGTQLQAKRFKVGNPTDVVAAFSFSPAAPGEAHLIRLRLESEAPCALNRLRYDISMSAPKGDRP